MFYKLKQWNRKRLDERRVKKLCKYIETNIYDDDKNEIIDFLKKRRKIHMFPYFWTDDYDVSDVVVEWDVEKQMYYALWHDKKMYWKSGYTREQIQECVNNLRIEQDERSPHLYTTNTTIDGAILCDCGAAEGCYSLDVIERVKHVYLFECDEDWIKALDATFEPWKEKVTIVNKYIGNEVDDDVTTLDDYFFNKEIDIVKADIEGAEIDLLAGGQNTLTNKVQAINICLYHKPDDEKILGDELKRLGFNCKINNGFMIIWERGLHVNNALRRGVLFAEKV